MGLRPAGPAKWWPDGAQFAADFISRRFMSLQRPCALEEVLDFARPSPATAMNAQGQCLVFAPDAARLTADGLLIEAEATNVLRKSSGLADSSAWNAEGYAATTGNTRNFGALVLEECAVTSPAPFPKFRSLDTLSLSDGEYGVVSFFAVAGTSGPLRTHVSEGAGNTATSSEVSGDAFSKGAIVENNSSVTQYVSDGMENFGNGLYRLWTVFRNVSGSVQTYQAVPHIQGTGGVPAMVSACWMGGHQLEKGRWPTSLILTSGAPETRAADSVTVLAEAAGLGSAPSVALSARWLGGHPDEPWLLSLNDGTADNEMGVYLTTGAIGIHCTVTADGVEQASNGVSLSDLSHGDRIAFALAINDSQIYARHNGGSIVESGYSEVDIPTITQMQVGRGQTSMSSGMVLESLVVGSTASTDLT
ncbi:phage head spike fiber domain-containing protein [Pelagibacterium halotolerans]|uniref:phage head spike fiber domain-containing protein n=1 Tax=Pelagibacterium halotolerans TaxID=531813 RepID=UPI000307B0D0|nr:hypothetical protein [Pelagibacterium halotolerans]QJR17243.1 hypothetical protein HKM20_01455 [Pelagibacterium halotolerans]